MGLVVTVAFDENLKLFSRRNLIGPFAEIREISDNILHVAGMHVDQPT
jgi:hypothetical protein